jgi:uncharacterized protein YjbJ (UPF0337 family)
VGQVRPFDAATERAGAVTQRLQDMQRGFEMNTRAARGFGGTAVVEFLRADLGATNFTRTFGGLAKAGIFAAIGGGIVGVISKARELNGEIQSLQREAGQEVKPFWSNWAEGWDEIIFGIQRTSQAGLLPTAEQRTANREQFAKSRFEQLSAAPDVVQKRFVAEYMLRPTTDERELRSRLDRIKATVAAEKFETEIETKAKVSIAGGDTDIAAVLADTFGRTDVFKQLGATIEERMAAVEGMVAGRVALPQGKDFNSEYFRQEFTRMTGEKERRDFTERARVGELSGRPDFAAELLKSYDKPSPEAERVMDTRAFESAANRLAETFRSTDAVRSLGNSNQERVAGIMAALEGRARLPVGDRDGGGALLAAIRTTREELAEAKQSRGSRLAELGATPDDRRAKAEGLAEKMQERAQKAIDAQNDAISQWRDLARSGPKFASADVLGTAEAQKAINEQKLGPEFKQSAERQLAETMKQTRSLEELVRNRIVLAVADLG